MLRAAGDLFPDHDAAVAVAHLAVADDDALDGRADARVGAAAGLQRDASCRYRTCSVDEDIRDDPDRATVVDRGRECHAPHGDVRAQDGVTSHIGELRIVTLDYTRRHRMAARTLAASNCRRRTRDPPPARPVSISNNRSRAAPRYNAHTPRPPGVSFAYIDAAAGDRDVLLLEA